MQTAQSGRIDDEPVIARSTGHIKSHAIRGFPGIDTYGIRLKQGRHGLKRQVGRSDARSLDRQREFDARGEKVIRRFELRQRNAKDTGFIRHAGGIKCLEQHQRSGCVVLIRAEYVASQLTGVPILDQSNKYTEIGAYKRSDGSEGLRSGHRIGMQKADIERRG